MAVTETSTRAHAALDDLYRRHVGDVYRYTYAVLGNHADAEDVTQTTFVNALRALERGEEPRNPSNWLLVIAHNVVRQRWRQAAARPSEVELVHDVPEVASEDDVELDGLVRALQRIPPAQREALVMRELEGRSYREIAELLGLTTSALETLLFRARRSLAEELENVVTCQNAELAISQRLDDRLSRKERRRLEEHLAECTDCSRLADAQRRQRKAFKGLALLPVPVGLAIFKGTPAASAATLPTIGLGATGAGGAATATGTVGAGATGVGAAGAGAASAGGAAVGGSLLGGAVAKVAAVVVAAGVATGVGYEGVKAVRDTPAPARPAVTKSRQVPTAVPVRSGTVGAGATTKAKQAGHIAPAHGRKDKTATDRPKHKRLGVSQGRSNGAKIRKTVERTVPRGKTPKVRPAPSPKTKQSKAPKPPRANKPKDALSAAVPPVDGPAEKPKQSPPSAGGPPASESPDSGSPPPAQAPASQPPAQQPPAQQPPAQQPPSSAPPAAPAPPSSDGSGASSDGNAHEDNGNHNGWDNANKAEKAADKAAQKP